MLPFLNYLCGLSLDLLQDVHISFFTRKPRCRWSTPAMTHHVWAEVKDHLPQPAAIVFLNAYHKACVSSPYTKSHCCPKVKVVSTRTPRSISAKLLSTKKSPSLYWGMGLLLPSGRIFSSFCWTPCDSHQPISPECQGASGCLHNPLVHQLLS